MNRRKALNSFMEDSKVGLRIAKKIRELKESEQKYHSIFSTLTEGVILRDTQGKVLASNSSAQKILNLTPSRMTEGILKNIRAGLYIHGDRTPYQENELPFIKASKTGQPQKHQLMGIINDSKTTWIIVNSIPFIDSSGKPYAIASSFDEITEQKNLEKQKDEFISIASHELKTPLTTIKSFTEILKLRNTDEKSLYYLEKMNSEIDRLTGLVNELLDVSKIQSGGLTLNKDLVEVDKLIAEVIEDVQTISPRHQIINKNKIKIQVPMDKYRIYQVLMNLISNAVKYSPKADKVLVYTEKKPDKIIFSVKDYGIGITKQDKKRVFDAFFQANTSIRQSHSGLGLGLHISKEIVTRHGGQISVYSRKGIGSVFRFYLPLKTKK